MNRDQLLRPALLACIASLAMGAAAPRVDESRGAPDDGPASRSQVQCAAVVRSAKVERGRDDRGQLVPDRVIADVPRGSISMTVDPKASAMTVDAEFTVDGTDAKDVERRTELVSLYTVRAADGTVVATPMFPGKVMPRDAVRLTIRVPESSDSSLKCSEGRIEVRGTAGDLKVSVKEGAIEVAGHTGAIDARSDSGTITLRGATAGVRARSASGAMSITLGDQNDHPFELESKSGSIAVEIGPGFDGAIRLLSTRGEVKFADPSKKARVTESDRHALTVEFGGAGAHSEIHSMDGDLTVTLRERPLE